jgi:flagellar biosynthesis/type III secretory pathway chaperone
MCILEEETGCYRTLYDMADNKKEVIIKGDVPSLQEIAMKEHDLAGHILRLEKKRKALIKDICTVTNKKEALMTVSKLVDILPKQESVKLKAVADDLEAVLKKFKRINDTNKQLIQQSLDYINFTVNVVHSMNSVPQGNIYQAKGNRYNDGGTNNFFDAKQ